MVVIVVFVVAVFVNVVAVVVFRAGRHPNGPLSPCHPPNVENEKARVLMSNDESDPNDRSLTWVIRLSKKLMKKSIIDGVNGEKGPFSLLRKKLAFNDDKMKSNANSNYSK